MKTLVLASNNPGKLQEMQAILAPLGWDVRPQGAFFSEEAVEDGCSFLENSLKKARFASQKTGLPALADDSGLQVPALGGQPGIYSARFAGEHATDELNNQKLLTEMQGLTGAERKACYYCALVLVMHAEDPTPVIGLGQWCGEVLTSPQGTGGFGYDPLIWLPEQHCSVAELDKATKNKQSHRALALQRLMMELQTQS